MRRPACSPISIRIPRKLCARWRWRAPGCIRNSCTTCRTNPAATSTCAITAPSSCLTRTPLRARTRRQLTDGGALKSLEPCLGYSGAATLLKERTVDPRALIAAMLKAAKHREIEVASGSAAKELMVSQGSVQGVKTAKTEYEYHAPVVVNCAGAWAGAFGVGRVPTKPVKGQMLALIAPRRGLLRHVVRAPEVYLVPRSDGRIVVGATSEDAGFDKRVHPDTIQRLHQKAADLVPELGQARRLEAWAGLRPGTPDELPILGRGEADGYFVAAGHYRNGILLAPITAVVMTQMIRGVQPEFELGAFRVGRF